MKTTLTVDEEYLEVLKGLVKEHGAKNQQEFFNAMVSYFKETGINPSTKTKSTADELSKLRNTVVSFIREQEKTKLDPLIGKFNETFEFLLNYFKNEAVTKSDLKELLSKTAATTIITKPHPVETKSVDNEKQRNYNNHAKSMFNEFTKHFKSSAFGGYTVEKTVLERYKSMFESL